jgi:hypothetical protein
MAHISVPRAVAAQKRFFEIVDNIFTQFKGMSKTDKATKKLAKMGPPSTWSKSKK